MTLWFRSRKSLDRRATQILIILTCLVLLAPDALADEGKVTGRVTYEKIPFRDGKGATLKIAMHFDKKKLEPVIGARVYLRSKADGKALDDVARYTNADGTYEIPWNVSQKTKVYVQVIAASAHVWIGDKQRPQKWHELVTADFDIFAGNVEKKDLVATDAKNIAGAFNILEAIRRADEFLKKEAGVKIAEIPTIKVSWTPGYNGPPGTTTHFSSYDNSSFIYGDRNVDSDEFDDYVITHEYGHFIMSVFSRDDSPGGNHGGDQKVDPRLAWSEGWANFFACAVLGDSLYIDTQGLNGTGKPVTFDLDKGKPKNAGYWSEMSVGIALWNITAKKGTGDLHLGVPFKKIWDVVCGKWAKRPHGTLIDFCDLLVEQAPDLGEGVAKVLKSQDIAYSPGKAPTVANYLYRRPLPFGADQKGVVDSASFGYRRFEGSHLYSFSLDKKTKVKLRFEEVGSDKKAPSRLDFLLYNSKKRQENIIDQTHVDASARIDYFEAELENGDYFVEIQSFRAGFNKGSYSLRAEISEHAAPVTHKRLSLEQLGTILKKFGYTFTPGEGHLNVKLGAKFTAEIQTLPDGTLVAACSGFNRVKLEQINKWNDDNWRCRAVHLDKAARLEADLDCDLGITDHMVRRFLQRYSEKLQEFDSFIGKSTQKEKTKDFTTAQIERFITDGMKTRIDSKVKTPTGQILYSTPDGEFDVIYDGAAKTVTFSFEFRSVPTEKADEWNRKKGKLLRAKVSDKSKMVSLSHSVSFAEGLSLDHLKEVHDKLKVEWQEFVGSTKQKSGQLRPETERERERQVPAAYCPYEPPFYLSPSPGPSVTRLKLTGKRSEY
jgi:hypothetical protein